MSRARQNRNPLQERQRLHTHKLICEAALEVFAANGYVATSIEQILLKAGVSRAAFYGQFDGKLAIVLAIARDFEPSWLPIFRYLAELEEPDLPELIQWATQHIEFHRKNSETCTLLTQVAALEEALYWQVARQRDDLIAMLAKGQHAFAAALHDPEIMLEARILLGQADQTCFHIVRQHLPNSDDTAARIIGTQMLHFLRTHGQSKPS